MEIPNIDINSPEIKGNIKVPTIDISQKIEGEIPNINITKIDGNINIPNINLNKPKIDIPNIDLKIPKIKSIKEEKINIPNVIGDLNIPKIDNNLDIKTPKNQYT